MTTSLAVKALGKTDFGVFGVVVSIAGLIMIVSDSLGWSAQRQMAIYLAQEDETLLKRSFGTCWAMVILLACLPVVYVFIRGKWTLDQLAIPDDRQEVAWWSLQTIIIGMAVGLLATPHRSLMLAKQDIVLLTLFEAADSMLRLGAACLAYFTEYDPLFIFSVATGGATGFCALGIVIICTIRYRIARAWPASIHRGQAKELLRIGGWDMALSGLWRVRTQGSQIILNLAFGPAINAANGIANQAAGYQHNLAFAILRAAHPAIIQRYAAGSITSLHRLMLVTSKYMMLAMSLLLIPLIFESETILMLWLHNPPAFTSELLILTAIWMAINNLTAGHTSVIYASGNLKKLTLSLMLVELIGFVIAGLWLIRYQGPVWGGAAVIVIITLMGVYTRACIGGEIAHLRFWQWLRYTVLPWIAVTGVVSLIVWLITYYFPPSSMRLMTVCVITVLMIPLLSWIIAMEKWEREQLIDVARSVLSTAVPNHLKWRIGAWFLR